jgi:hypothetical protein
MSGILCNSNAATPARAREARARAWAYVLACYSRKEAARPGRREDDVKEAHEYVATGNHTKHSP